MPDAGRLWKEVEASGDRLMAAPSNETFRAWCEARRLSREAGEASRPAIEPFDPDRIAKSLARQRGAAIRERR
jgi:hypothetical protein